MQRRWRSSDVAQSVVLLPCIAVLLDGAVPHRVREALLGST